MIIQYCPICAARLKEDEYTIHYSEYNDLICRQEDHLFAIRVNKKNSSILELKAKFQCEKEKFYIKIFYVGDYTEIWSANTLKPIRVPGVLVSDFNDVNRIKQKIKTCLLFS